MISRLSSGNVFRLPVLPELLTGIEREAELRQINLMVATTADEKLPRILQDNQCDGLLFLGIDATRATGQAIAGHLEHNPGVWLMRDTNDLDLPCDRVFYDNAAVGDLAARYLSGRGHRSVAMIDPRPDHSAHAERRRSFVETCRRQGVECVVCESVAEDCGSGRVTPEQTIRVVDQFLSLPQRPTGVFVPRDQLTQAVASRLEAQGVRVGYDLDIVSCDNNADILEPIALRPPSIALHLDEVGANGLRRLVDRIQNPKAPQQHIYVQPSLEVPDGWPRWRDGHVATT